MAWEGYGMKLIDALGAALVAIGIVMTALLFIALRHPPEVESITINEIPAAPPPHNNGI
jgi:hypothetical protein